MADEQVRIFTDKEIPAAISNLIKEADRFFTLVSPEISFLGSYLTDIADAAKRIQVCVMYNPHDFNEDDPKSNHLERLPKEVKQHRVEWLHAKIYISDKSLIITSMNYTRWSTSNREIAVRFDRNTAQSTYDAVSAYVDGLLGKVPSRDRHENTGQEEKACGHCIYCGREVVPYDIEQPRCSMHNISGIKPDHIQKYCYNCGEKRATSLANPLCTECRPGG